MGIERRPGRGEGGVQRVQLADGQALEGIYLLLLLRRRPAYTFFFFFARWEEEERRSEIEFVGKAFFPTDGQ